MKTLESVCNAANNLSLPITRICNIKKYLPINSKFEFLKEYDGLIKSHFEDHEGFEEIVAIVFFSLLVVKKYTDIELELTYDEYDKLQETGLFSKIIEAIGDDHVMLLNYVKMGRKK